MNQISRDFWSRPGEAPAHENLLKFDDRRESSKCVSRARKGKVKKQKSVFLAYSGNHIIKRIQKSPENESFSKYFRTAKKKVQIVKDIEP